MQINSLGLSRLGGSGSPLWYNSGSFRLNGIRPSFIHDYIRNRYWNSSAGAVGFPFTGVRASNATMFDNLGRMVWSPANMSPTPSIASFTSETNPAGVTGPNGETTGITRLTATGTDPLYGNLQVTSSQFLGQAVSYTISLWVKGEGATIGKTARFYMYRDGVTDVQSSTTFTIPSNWARFSATYAFTTAPTVDTTFRVDLPDNAVVGDTVCVFGWQVERTGIDSPKAYIANGGTASYRERFDYNPTDLSFRGYLVEPQSTNLMARSASNNPADWNLNFTSYASAGTVWSHPVITMSVTATTNPQFGYITVNSLSATNGTAYTISAFFKKTNHSFIQMTTSANYTVGTTPYLNYDFDTNTITTGGTGLIANSQYAQILQDGWVRLQFSFTANATASGAGVIIGFINNLSDTRLPICTNASASVQVFGFQAEAGNQLATSYIPTYGVAVTRSADQPTITTFPWFNQSRGTWYIEAITNMSGVNTRRFLDISDGTSAIRIQAARGAANTSCIGNTSFIPASSAVSDFSLIKMVIRHNGTARKVVTNNGTVGTDSTAGSLPTSGFTQVNIGHIAGYVPGNSACCWMRSLIYWDDDTATDPQLQAKTI